MLERILFTLSQLNLKKSKLKTFYKNKNNKISSVLDLPLDFCAQKNIEILVLDFDGVLASHGEIKPEARIHVWLENLVKSKTVKKICILSNKPSLSRAEFFKDHFPEFIWVSGVRKKPYPDGLLKIIQDEKIDPKLVCLIDDRLLTGILAAELAGTQAILITKPLSNFERHFFKECFFASLRFLEQLYLK